MSSLRSSLVSAGYAVRLATQADTLRFLYFQEISNGYLFGKVNTVLLLLLLMLTTYAIFSILPLSSLSSATSPVLGFSIFIISVICLFILCLIYFCLRLQKYRSILKNEFFSIWLIERSDTIHGYAWCASYDQYTFIVNFLISKASQGNGLGSFLLNFIADTCRKPIYLACNVELKNFYYRNGFIDADSENLPNELSRFDGNPDVCIMCSRP